MIHEAARPFVTKKEFLKLVYDPCDNAVFGIDIPFTVSKQNNGFISELLKRDTLACLQTPHKFLKTELLAAHEKAITDNLIFTDDANTLYYYNKCDIKIIPGQYYNIKITTPVDILTAEIIYNEYFTGN